MKERLIKEVCEFIERRWKITDAKWTDGNCYWFAHILCTRFPLLDIYYLPVVGHFVAGYEDVYFDWNGMYKPETTTIYKLSDIEVFDKIWFKRLMRDCRD